MTFRPVNSLGSITRYYTVTVSADLGAHQVRFPCTYRGRPATGVATLARATYQLRPRTDLAISHVWYLTEVVLRGSLLLPSGRIGRAAVGVAYVPNPMYEGDGLPLSELDGDILAWAEEHNPGNFAAE